MKRSLRVAALQLRAHDRSDFRDAFEPILRRVERIASQADLIVLPEATMPAYVLGDGGGDESAVERAIDRLRACAKEFAVVIVAGAAVRDGGKFYNAGIVIDRDGTIAGRAEKIFLWHFDRRWFEGGRRIAPVQTSAGVFGVLICADGRMPGISRALVDAGAEILLMPTAWVSSGRDPSVLENVQADLLGRMRAYENGVPFVAANKCGVERDMVLYCGKSQIVSQDGEIVAMAGERDDEDLVQTLTIGEPKPHRSQLAQPPQRDAPVSGTLRIAISAAPLPNDALQRLEILETPFAIAPGEPERLAALDRVVPVAEIDDATMLDPAGLVPFRRAGYRLALWRTKCDAWTQRIARARAGELRMYVVVIDSTAGCAFAVDPQSAVICGTFNDYRIASCTLDLAKAAQTLVAPGTDIAQGLERVEALTR
ncbi:MAG: carbon-nitrogen hydrolase family protein [Candidatus Tyrphobacter sp.]